MTRGPIIEMLTDEEIEQLRQAARETGRKAKEAFKNDPRIIEARNRPKGASAD